MKLRLFFAPLLAVVTLTSCEDLFEDGTKPDGSKPYVTVNAPTANHSFTKANGVTVSLTVVDKDEVRDLNVQISDLHGEAPFVDFTKHYTQTVAVLDTVVAADRLSAGSYKLVITAKDKRTNVEKREVIFNVK